MTTTTEEPFATIGTLAAKFHDNYDKFSELDKQTANAYFANIVHAYLISFKPSTQLTNYFDWLEIGEAGVKQLLESMAAELHAKFSLTD